MGVSRVLIVDRQERLHRRLMVALSFEHIETVSVFDAEEADGHIASSNWGLMIIGEDRADSAAVSLLVQLRRSGRHEPVLWVTGDGQPERRVRLYRLGANDVANRGADTDELVARALNLMTLSGAVKHAERYRHIDTLTIDKQSRTVFRESNPIELTPTEYKLLLFLAEHAGSAMPRDTILRGVWGYDFYGQTNLVDVYIRYLRLKVDKGYGKKLIHTVRGFGYMVATHK